MNNSIKNVLLVEDDKETAKLLQLHFHSQLYNLTWCDNGKEARTIIDTRSFDLIVLDISLPEISGIELCKHIRDMGSHVPVIMLTSRFEEASKVLSLDLGADDYITKPFSSMELMSRVNALLRRSVGWQHETEITEKKIIIKELVIDINQFKATLRGQRLQLTKKEFNLLFLLASAPGKTFTRAQLLEQIWGTVYTGYSNVVPTLVNRLRNKLEVDIEKPEYILTSWGNGYRFCDVEDAP